MIPGGRSPEYLAHIPSVVALVTEFVNSEKPIAAICHGPLILAAAEVVNGRRCTSFLTVGPVLIAAGAHWVKPETFASTMAVVDGNLITAVTYKGHPQYIRHIVKALGGNISGSESDKKILFLCGVSLKLKCFILCLINILRISIIYYMQDYMEGYEVTVPFQSLEALGCHVDAVSPKKKAGEACRTAVHELEGDQTYSEKPGYDFVLNANFDDVKASSYDALVIPGGRAPAYLALNDSVIALVKHFMDSNKPVASIGHGQKVLAAAGVLKVMH